MDARFYLQDHRIPQLFEGLMTGLIYHRPDKPLEYLEQSISTVRKHPEIPVSWDMFISNENETTNANKTENMIRASSRAQSRGGSLVLNEKSETNIQGTTQKVESSDEKTMSRSFQRVPSVTRAAEVVVLPDVPIILFMGGPGGGKTRHATRVADSLMDEGLVHICMPEIIKQALAKYKDKYPEWKEANDNYTKGELIPNQLALTLLRAEMGKYPDAKGFLLEGYPREARQVEDFERQIKAVNMALILDYDEKTLREHMERRGLNMEIIDRKIKEFKQKTLPSAKYFDDQKLLHLIPGEKDDQAIFERMRSLLHKALETGVPVSMPTQQASNVESPKPGKENRSMSPKEAVPSTIETLSTNTQTISSETVNTAESMKADVKTKEVEERNDPSPTSESKTKESETPNKSVILSPKESVNQTADVHTENQEITTKDTDEAHVISINSPVILLLGAPGSQKSEVGRRIIQKYDGLIYISLGESLRRKANNEKEDAMWKMVSEKMSQGEPIPTKLCQSVLYEQIRTKGGSATGIVLDGYPKTVDQLKDIEVTLKGVDVGILIDCTEQFCLNVIRTRQLDTKRIDDEPDAVKARMDFFKKNTLPMLKFLDEQGKLRVIDGDSQPDVVFKDVTQVLDHTLAGNGNGHQESV